MTPQTPAARAAEGDDPPGNRPTNLSTRAVIAWVRFCVWRQRVNGEKADRANRKAFEWQYRWLKVKRKCQEEISQKPQSPAGLPAIAVVEEITP